MTVLSANHEDTVPAQSGRIAQLSLIAFSVAFVATIVATNWAVQHLPTARLSTWLIVPAGAWFAGVAFSLRDYLSKVGGWRWAVGAILAGTAVSALVAGSGLLIASASAFLLSELVDWVVYTPLERRGGRWDYVAVVASNGVGALVDSYVFLWLASHVGHIDYLNTSMAPGQWVGKFVTTVPVLALMLAARVVTAALRRRRRQVD